MIPGSRSGTKARTLLVLGVLALALAACAAPPRSRAPAAAPPAPATSAPAATATGAPAAPVPGSAQWIKPGTSNAAYRADLESCYDFALARVAHDERIESDSSAAFDTFPSGLGVSELSGQMSEFERRNRRASLYNECMRAKGYRAQQ